MTVQATKIEIPAELLALPRTRKEAKALNSKHYFNGKPCPKGHVDKRFASSGTCFRCVYESTAKQSKAKLAANRDQVLSMRLTCKECGAEYTPEYGRGKKHKAACYCSQECRKAADDKAKKQWVKENPDKRKEAADSYGYRIRAERGEQWRKERTRNANYIQNRLAKDPEYRLTHNLRTRLNMALRNFDAKKRTSVTKLVGCSMPALRKHLEAQFQEGMSWDNRSEWHIDHIRPIASFDRPDHPDCWHYTNLRPLWAVENLKKGSKAA